jgi:Excreted virulence factor EspC, type VII ESX diderm
VSSAFEVVPDDLVAHASHVDGLVDRLNTAVSAAETAMSPDAYGLICAFLPPIVNPAGEQAKDAISAAVQGVQQMADNVRTAAEAYRDNEQVGKQSFSERLVSS